MAQMKHILIAVLLFSFVTAEGQNDQGVIIYDRKLDYTKMMQALPYLSQEEKDRISLTWGKSGGRGSNYNLTFDPNKAVYTYGVNDREYNWSWRQDEYLVIDKLNKSAHTMQFVLGGRLYLLDDEKSRTRWKIKNEIREIAGYLCMKAVTRDTIKDQTIEAWFTDQIPVAAGPEGYSGLPGMILMLDINDGTAIVEATSVEMKIPEHPIPKKIKGRKLDTPAYTALLEKFFKESIEGQRNPFWEIRY